MRVRTTWLLPLAFACGGCATMALPPSLSDAERSELAGANVPLTVGVERYEAPVYSDALLDGLRATRLFDRVAPVEEFSARPSLVARVSRGIHGEAMIPLVTLLTVGIVPTSVDEEAGYSFTLTPSDRPDEHVGVEYSHIGRSTLGWIALADFIFVPDRTVLVHPRSSARMIDRLALAILDRKDELMRLAGASP